MDVAIESIRSYTAAIPPALHGWVMLVAAIVTLSVAAKAAGAITNRYLRRLAQRTEMDLDDEMVRAAQSVVPALIVATGINLTLDGLADEKPVSLLTPTGIDMATRIVWSLALVVVALSSMRLLNLLIARTMKRLAQRARRSEEIRPLLVIAARATVVGCFVLLFLATWGQPIAPLLASAGVVGAAIAFAARESLANLFGGVSILLEGSIKIGDYIVLDNGERGEVVQIGIRSTQLKTRDDVLITIPNGIMANSMIINQSAPWAPFRVRLAVGVAYGSDLDEVEALLVREAVSNVLTLDEPEPRARVRGFGDNAVEFELLAWCGEPAERGILIHELSKAVYATLAKEGIDIPFPQRDVRLVNDATEGPPLQT